jgi:hypothetical protein
MDERVDRLADNGDADRAAAAQPIVRVDLLRTASPTGRTRALTDRAAGTDFIQFV